MNEKIKEGIKSLHNDGSKLLSDFIDDKEEKKIASLRRKYQIWYTKALIVIKEILPDRYEEFTECYSCSKRKEISYSNFSMNDYLIGICISRGGVRQFDPRSAGLIRFATQLDIVKSICENMDDVLFNIKSNIEFEIMDNELILLECEEKMEKTIEAFTRNLANIRTGRATPAMLDKVMVEYYGSPTPLNQVAGVSVQEGRQLVIKAYDKSAMKEIERGIYEADYKFDLGLIPMNDGTVIRINVPPLTEDRRRELVKQVKKAAEDAKVALRNERRRAIDQISKDSDEDAVKDGKNDVQKLIDKYTKKIEEVAKAKEDDLMTV